MTTGEARIRSAGPGAADSAVGSPAMGGLAAAHSAVPAVVEATLAESELASHLDQLIEALRNPQTGLWAARQWGRLLAAPLTAGHRLAIALHAETSSLTAIGNDFGPAEAFARQVAAHGRPGDTLLVLSASGRSENVLAAASRARSLGIRVWAMTGPPPNPLASMADDAICVAAPDTATVQEVHLVAIHALCDALDTEVISL
jgi:hypothetical protein